MQRRHQHHIESEIEVGKVRALGQESFGGAGDAPALARCQCGGRHGELVARLDLDDREHLAAARQNVDLAARATPAARDDMPAAQPQVT